MRQESESGEPEGEGGESESGAETTIPALSSASRQEKTAPSAETSAQDGFSVASAAQIGAYRAMAEVGRMRPASGGFSIRI
jgi:hypothetical protein